MRRSLHGVPLVVAPIRLGELAVAEQVTRAGAGITVSFAEATPAQLAAAVTAVLDEPGYRAQARRIGAEFAGGRAGQAPRPHTWPRWPPARSAATAQRAG